MSHLNNCELENQLELAEGGEIESVRSFLAKLLESSLILVDRSQPKNLTLAPNYPNEFVRFLGVQDGDRILVPAFTTAERISDWFPHPLNVHESTFRSLLNVLPDNWWIVVNPNSELYKELSPWELKLLQSGPEGLEELLDELRQMQAPPPKVQTNKGHETVSEVLNQQRAINNPSKLLSFFRKLFLRNKF